MKHKAVALMSGGLDSNIAVKLMHEMGIEMLGVHFTGPFCQCNRGNKGCLSFARTISETLGIELRTIGLGDDYLEIVRAPRFGYGSGINPCMDCRILMFGQAGKLMREENASFIVTGEVLSQRPMSQMRDKLALIERESGLDGLILRPLSAKHLPETIPERSGWVDREKLLAIEGRQRKQQMELARFFQIGDYPCPSGGCLLTDKHFARRMRDHMDHARLEMAHLPLLKVGRHFRLPGGSKLVLGRDEAENERLETLAGNHELLIPVKVMGPSGVFMAGAESESDRQIALSIAAHHCDGEGDVTVSLCFGGHQAERVTPRAARERVELFRV